MFWEREGGANTEPTVALAVDEARSRGIQHLVVASNSGDTARSLLARGTDGLSVVCVTHQVGFRTPGQHEMPAGVRAELEAAGVRLLTTTHLMGGVDRACRMKFGGHYPPEIVADALRMLGHGVKVCVEIAVMALDAGAIPYGEDVIALAGRARGADTACVVRPAHSMQLFDTRVRDILCRPQLVAPGDKCPPRA